MKRNIGFRLKKSCGLLLIMASVVIGICGSCDKTKSYSQLLNEEEHAVNWYLAQQEIALEIPSDGKFLTGPDAPYYKMDKDGYVYMQVLDPGDSDSKPEKGNRVYFRFMRMNLLTLMNTDTEMWEGNAENMGAANSYYLIYGNNVLTSTTKFGEGIQVPLEYLGYNSEVNLVIKSPEGFTEDMSSCTPYVYNIRYFKAEY